MTATIISDTSGIPIEVDLGNEFRLVRVNHTPKPATLPVTGYTAPDLT